MTIPKANVVEALAHVQTQESAELIKQLYITGVAGISNAAARALKAHDSGTAQ